MCGISPSQRVVFADDFTGTDAAAWSATKWTTDNFNGGTTPDILTNKGRMQTFNGTGAGGARALAIHPVTVDVMVTGTVDLISGPRYENRFCITMRGDGTWTTGKNPTNGITTIIAQVDAQYQVEDCVPTYTSLGTIAKDTSVGGIYQFRALVIGSAVKFKAWLASGAEPTAWDQEYTTARTAAGILQLCLAWYNIVYVDNILVVAI